MHLREEPGRIVISLDLARPAEEVWAGLTGARHLAHWWGDYVELDAVPGGRLVERWRDAAGRLVETAGVVTRCESPRRLEITWADDGWPVETRVSFRLEDTPAGTRLTLEHAGWDCFPGEEGWRLLRDHADGWARHMRSFSAYLAQAV